MSFKCHIPWNFFINQISLHCNIFFLKKRKNEKNKPNLNYVKPYRNNGNFL